ncbi:MAG: Poly(glycerol-phosphate) alpha-glucosyltransferase [Firmicutes bacterium]|nr:Poly(glycerol-phosphate) alpha-glucosyltransferase [Bacillota bacterium]MDI6705241.1 polysaccharide pyruvyl transferase CsaB [Bacillota bacterium]
MYRILISGYYGFGNVGDESILTSIVDSLNSVSKGVDITVLSANPPFTEARHGINAVDRKNFFEIYMAIKNCDLFISGGGGLLQDITSEKSIRYYLGLIYIAKRLRKKVMVYGQGIGPITKKSNRRLTRNILNTVDAITVRDEQSLKDLKNMGVEIPPIHLTADPVVALRPTGTGTGSEVLKAIGIDTDKPVVGFSVREWKDSEKFNHIIAKTADNLIEELGFQVVFIPFHYGEDNDCIERIKSIMKNGAYSVDQRFKVKELLDLVGELDLMIGVRLHSLIFSAIQGVPLIGVSYDPKIDGFLAQIGMKPVGKIDDVELSDMLIEVQRVWNNRETIRMCLDERIGKLREQAEINNTLVFQLLE